MVQSSLLYGVVENTKFNRHQIEKKFGKKVVPIVDELTTNKRELEKMRARYGREKGKTRYLGLKMLKKNKISDKKITKKHNF